MAFSVEVEITRQFEVKCPFDRVFDILSDVPTSASHFPTVNALVDLGNNCYRWELAKIGIDRFSVQTVYACKYTDDREKGWVKWVPIKGEGNGILKGKWSIKALDEQNTRIHLATSGELGVPLPSLVKMLVAPLVVSAFQKMVDRYIENLRSTFEKKSRKKVSPRT